MLYLAYVDGDHLDEGLEGPWQELRPLTPQLALIDSPHPRSPVYHALKDHLPADAPLLVTELAEVPKFKGMAPGSLTWARSRRPSG